MLEHRDFTPENSIHMISLCRDEITRDLVEELDSLWGQSFNISSLAGLVLCGCTSFKAAMVIITRHPLPDTLYPPLV